MLVVLHRRLVEAHELVLGDVGAVLLGDLPQQLLVLRAEEGHDPALLADGARQLVDVLQAVEHAQVLVAAAAGHGGHEVARDVLVGVAAAQVVEHDHAVGLALHAALRRGDHALPVDQAEEDALLALAQRQALDELVVDQLLLLILLPLLHVLLLLAEDAAQRRLVPVLVDLVPVDHVILGVVPRGGGEEDLLVEGVGGLILLQHVEHAGGLPRAGLADPGAYVAGHEQAGRDLTTVPLLARYGVQLHHSRQWSLSDRCR